MGKAGGTGDQCYYDAGVILCYSYLNPLLLQFTSFPLPIMPKLADIRESRVFTRKASEVLWKRGPVILESNGDSQLLSVHAQFPNIVPETELDVDPTNWECFEGMSCLRPSVMNK
jgi:hypothetical protein